MSICPGCGRCRVCGSPPNPSPYPPANPFVPYPGTGTPPWPNPNTSTPWPRTLPTITYC